MNEENVNLVCAVCEEEVENVLGLGCNHNMCLNCTLK